MVYLEAWASGKPVIGAKNPVMEEVISDGKDGLLVDFDDPQALSEAINALVSDPALAAEMGGSGRERVKKNNSWQKVAADTRGVYLSLLGK